MRRDASRHGKRQGMRALRAGPALAFVLGLAAAASALQDAPGVALPDGEVVMDALAEELERALTLRLEDLEQPYFVQLDVLDRADERVSASYGAVYGSGENRSRSLSTALRIGSHELDNTHFSAGGGFFAFFGGPGGGMASLPVDDDALAIRHSVWLAADQAYKDGVETLTKKRAYLKDKTIEDRPHDFTPGEGHQHADETVSLSMDRAAWEARLERLSARFARHERIQDSGLTAGAGARQRYMVDSEGSRLRLSRTGASLRFWAEAQAPDGMRFSDARTYTASTADGLPDEATVLADIDAMVARLEQAMDAPVLESYTGPVLFDADAAARVMREFLADGIAGHVEPVGTERASPGGRGSLEKKIGQRILPRSFQVLDDPSVEYVGETLLAGHYAFDDEGTPARLVQLVADGKLQALVMSRSPTKKISGSTGHGRRSSPFSQPQASVGCLFVRDEDGLSDEELKQELMAAARDEGLEYGIRVSTLKGGGGTPAFFSFFGRGGGGGDIDLPDPLYVTRVYVDDGREEAVRGCEFGAVNIRALKRILAGGSEPGVHNTGAQGGGIGAPSSVIAPALLFEELELNKIEQELDKLPLLPDPAQRAG